MKKDSLSNFLLRPYHPYHTCLPSLSLSLSLIVFVLPLAVSEINAVIRGKEKDRTSFLQCGTSDLATITDAPRAAQEREKTTKLMTMKTRMKTKVMVTRMERRKRMMLSMMRSFDAAFHVPLT